MEEVGLHLLNLVEPGSDNSGTSSVPGGCGNVCSPYWGCLLGDCIWVDCMDVKSSLCLPGIDVVMELLPLSIGDQVGGALLEERNQDCHLVGIFGRPRWRCQWRQLFSKRLFLLGVQSNGWLCNTRGSYSRWWSGFCIQG